MTLTIPKNGWYADDYTTEKHTYEFVGQTIGEVRDWLDIMGYLSITVAEWASESEDYNLSEIIEGIIDGSDYASRDYIIHDWVCAHDGAKEIQYRSDPNYKLRYYKQGDLAEEDVTVIYEYDEDNGDMVTLAEEE